MLGRKKQQDHGKKDASRTPSDGEIFGTPPAEQPGYGDVFSSSAAFASEPDPFGSRALPQIPLRPRRLPAHLSHLSSVQKILLLGILAVTVMLVVALATRTTHKDQTGQPQAQTAQLPSVVGQPPTETPGQQRPAWDTGRDTPRLGTSSPSRPELADVPEPSIPGPEPLSLQLANKLHQNREYEHAFVVYDKLYRRLLRHEREPAAAGLSAPAHGPVQQATAADVAQADTFCSDRVSEPPADPQGPGAVLSEHHADRAAAAISKPPPRPTRRSPDRVAEIDDKWVSAVQQQCWFLVAEAVSRNLLSLSDADANLPPELWSAASGHRSVRRHGRAPVAGLPGLRARRNSMKRR